MPFAVGCLVLDRFGPSRHALFGSGAPRGRQSLGVGREAFREHAVDGIGPAAIVLDDLVGDVTHWKLPFAGLTGFAESECTIYSMLDLAASHTL